MAENIKCDKCGGDEFIKVISIPITKPPVILKEKKIICAKCKDELTADEVNEALAKA